MRDSDEFDAFYAGSSRRILGQVYAMTGELAEAEDVVAEAYARAWQRWRQVRDCDDPEAWVRRAAARIAGSSWRKAVNRLRAQRRDTVDAHTRRLDPGHVALAHALRGIPAVQRRVIVLHHLAGMSVPEIAAEVGSPPGTIKARLARGRSAMAAHLAADENAYGLVNHHG